MNIWLDAAFWMGLALAASLISVWLGISVAMVEIMVGVVGGNFLGLHATPWVDFLAGFGSILLTFLAGAEVELAGVMSRETRLARHKNAFKDFDIGFIDCPPSLGLLTVNALVAADSLLVPIQCEYFALEGVGQLMRTVSLVRRYLNEDIELDGVVLTMFDSRTNLAREVAEEVRAQFKKALFETIIPRNIRLSEAPSFGKPIYYYDAASAGAKAFGNLAEEVIGRWLGKRR